MYLLSKKALLHFIVVFVCLFFILSLPSILNFQTSEQKQLIVTDNNAKSQDASVSSIFNNNLIVALLSFVPYAGWGLLIAVLWNTGNIISAYSSPVVTLLLNPFVYVELGVCGFVILKSIYIVRLFKRRKTIFTNLDGVVVVRKTTGVYYEMAKTLAVVLIVCSIVLLISAFAEIYWIRCFS